MMKNTLTLIVALLSATLLVAKPYTQQGIAYLYDYKTKTKSPVANVSLTVAYAKGPAVSREDGTFTIEFQDFGAGKKLAFEKQPFSQGLMVLNKKEVDGWSTFEGRLTLIMCIKKDFDVCKQNYYDIGFQSVTQRYERKIAALKQESADYQQRLQELKEERDRIMDNLRNSADAMARIDQSELDAAMQEVLDLYEQGNVEEAMKKLENMRLEEKFMQTLKRKQQLEHAVETVKEDSIQILNKLRTSVDMYKNSGNWDKAAETLKLLADKLNTFDDIFSYAYFCRCQNDFTDAEIYYKKANEIPQRLAKDNPKAFEPYMVITTLFELAALYSQTQRLTEAEEMYKQMLEVFQKLAKDNPAAYEPDVAQTLNNLANLYTNTQRFTEAEDMYKQALEIQQRLAKDNPKAFEFDVAQMLHNLANLYSNTQRFTEAEKMYKQALEIQQRLAKDNPKAFESDVAQTLHNLANLYSDTQRLTEAEEMYKQALEIRQRLAQDNPKAFESDEAQTLHSLANLYSKNQWFTEAEEMYKQTLEIYMRLVKDNPEAFESDVALTIYNLGLLYSDTQRFTEAEEMLKQALDIYQRITKGNPKACEPYVAHVLNNLSGLYYQTQRLTESEEMYKQALEIYQQIAQDNPKVYEPDVAMTLYNMAILYYNTQRFTEAEEMYKQTLEIRQRLAKANPQTYELDLARTLYNLAILYSDTQRHGDAEAMYKEALKIHRRLAEDNPQAYEPDVAMTLNNLAVLYYNIQRMSDAVALYKEALEIYRRIVKINPYEQQGYLRSLYWLSQLYTQTNNRIAAYQANQELLPLLKAKYDEDADSWRNYYAEMLNNQSFYTIFMKDYPQAEQLAREGLAVDSTQYVISTNLAAALLFQGKYAEAETIYRHYKDELKDSFLDDFKQFKAAGVIPKEREEDVEKIKRMLEE